MVTQVVSMQHVVAGARATCICYMWVVRACLTSLVVLSIVMATAGMQQNSNHIRLVGPMLDFKQCVWYRFGQCLTIARQYRWACLLVDTYYCTEELLFVL